MKPRQSSFLLAPLPRRTALEPFCHLQVQVAYPSSDGSDVFRLPDERITFRTPAANPSRRNTIRPNGDVPANDVDAPAEDGANQNSCGKLTAHAERLSISSRS